jgi:hypothetical protein
MEAPIHLLLICAAILLFLFAGVGAWNSPEWPWRYRLMAWGLCCWALSTIVKI